MQNLAFSNDTVLEPDAVQLMTSLALVACHKAQNAQTYAVNRSRSNPTSKMLTSIKISIDEQIIRM